MNYICGEKLSQRLHIRMNVQIERRVSQKENRDMFAFIEQRISLSWAKLLSRMLIPVKTTINLNLDKVDYPVLLSLAPGFQVQKHHVLELCIQAVFSLFVAIFYKNADDPADGINNQKKIRDEGEGFLASFSSLLYWKKNKFLSEVSFVVGV